MYKIAHIIAMRGTQHFAALKASSTNANSCPHKYQQLGWEIIEWQHSLTHEGGGGQGVDTVYKCFCYRVVAQQASALKPLSKISEVKQKGSCARIVTYT